MLVHQSDLAEWGRCAARLGYRRAGLPTKSNSALAFGSVMHSVIHGLERQVIDGVPVRDAVANALKTFDFYWHPSNIAAICPPVPPDGWMKFQSYTELRTRGIETIRKYADLVRLDDQYVLALEFSFVVPIAGTWDEDRGEPHMLGGSIDKLVISRYYGKPVVNIVDFKTGKDQYLWRHNVQFTVYCLASTLKEFWVGYRDEDGFGGRGEELYRRFHGLPRRGTVINLKSYKVQDAGFRGPQDYERLKLAVEQYVASVKADIFPLSISGDNCSYCEFREVCGGIGLPAEEHGAP